MKKRKINKIVSLTLCFLVFTSVIVSAKTYKDSNNLRTYSMCGVDSFPKETNPPL